MRPYEEFKELILPLFQAALDYDKLYLGTYTQISSFRVKKANEEHKCGTCACVAGLAPEVYPDHFEWAFLGGGVEPICKDAGGHGGNIIKFFTGVYGTGLHVLFAANNTRHNYFDRFYDDYVVTMWRMLDIKNSNSYDELLERINNAPEFY